MLNFPGSLAGNGTDMSVLEKQQLRLSLSLSLLKQHHQFQPKSFDFNAMPQFQGLVLHSSNGGFDPDLSGFPVLSTEFHHGHGLPEMDQSAASGTCNYAPKEEEGLVGNENIVESSISNGIKKRKAESEKSRDKKRNRGDAGENQNQKEKLDYVHVRARRGQATDSHSLAERARREKINKKMKCLQELVPGCNKPTGKAGMLDEIINYVQSLQRQVEFLSMKLAHVNPGQQLIFDSIFSKEFPSCVASTLSEMANLAYNQTNSATSCELDMLMPLSPQQTAPPRISSSPVSQAQSFSNWEIDLQKLYNASAGFQ